MTMSKRLRLAVPLAPLLGALTFAMPAQAASPGHPHVESGHHDFHHDRDHDRDRGRFGFGFGFWDPWWGWGPADWGYAYPYYYPPYPYYYPPDPAYYAPPAGAPPQSPAPTESLGAPPPQSWYYCDNPQGYYPYVQNCSTAWRQVAATPPQGSGNTINPKAK
jgi:hypothetical protein